MNFNLEDGVLKVNEYISENFADKKGPFIILVAGGTASGKTSRVANKIQEEFLNSSIISMDNYYRGHTFMDEQKENGNELNWDQPDALNLELFSEHLSELKLGKTVLAPEYDFKTDPVFEAIKIEPKNIIIVEGLFALEESIADIGDLNIFVDIGSHGQIMRRIFRDIKRTGEKPQKILEYFLDIVEPMHEKYIEPTKQNADIIISNAYIPKIESKNSEVIDTNFKLLLNGIDKDFFEEEIYKLGGTYLGEVEHNDRYFNPSDRILSESDEVIKIRKIFPDKLLLSYKGPKNNDSLTEERFVIRFFIEEDTYSLFKHVYTDKIKEIYKYRRNYYLFGVLLSIDIFDNGKIYLNCKYEKGQNLEKLYNFFESLEIDIDKKINDRYLNIV
ncbi:MAG: CYTH domain-containing protein [Candidatus Gracilibacteria bacterium]|nr:CYTH domain-containing protein [Candidatus Gracilibacteria bacterium]